MALVQTEQLARVLKGFDLQANPNAVSAYADVLHFKNDNIKRLFENHPDGRIVLNAKEVCSLDSVRNFGLDIISQRESDELFNKIRRLVEQNTSFTNLAIGALTKGFSNIICSPFLNTQTKKIEDRDGLLSSLKGMKIGKALNLILDSNIIAESSWIGYKKQDIDYIRNNIIGGLIADIIDNAGSISDDLSLVLSINPLDFLTMSCGTSWDSCMYPTGEYSTGTLPYATGRDTVIGFLVNTKDYETEIECSGWSNKIWRQIMYLTDDNFIISQNPYPGDKPRFSVALSAYINEALGLNLEITKEASSENVERLNVRNIGISTGYIDLEHSGYLPYIFGVNTKETDRIKVWAQSVVYCLDCGGLKHDWEMASSCGLCESCEDCYDFYCEHCGEGFYDCEGAVVDGCPVCDSCLEYDYSYSSYHSGYIHNDDAVEVKTIKKRIDGRFYIDVDVVEQQVLDRVAILVRDIDFLPEILPFYLDLDDYIFVDDLEEVQGGYYLPQ